MTDALIVFAKRPVPGQVKTRLTAVLSAEEAAGLYEAFLRDALRLYVSLEVDVRLYLSPPGAPVPAGLVPAEVEVLPQRGEGLGARMLRAFVETFAAGYRRAVVIGTDHPTLPPAFIEQAFGALREPFSVSIGPSADGGYYLLGMNELYAGLFTDMTYSHPHVFEETLERIAGTEAHLAVLPLWYDVDTPEALQHLAEDLAQTSLPLPHTRRVVERLRETHPGLLG